MKRALALFAKHPAATPVKTRLVPPLTAVEATTLAGAFLDDSIVLVDSAARRADAAPCVFCDPPSACDDMVKILPSPFRTYAQSGGDLSERLETAYATLAGGGFQAVCFIGSDSPTLPAAYVARAFAALDAGRDIVLGPASDGGYYLIGLRDAHLGVFDRIDWSTSRVFAQTMARAAELQLSVEVLDEWYDVDDMGALRRLCAELLRADTQRALASKTAAVLTDLFASDRTRRLTFT